MDEARKQNTFQDTLIIIAQLPKILVLRQPCIAGTSRIQREKSKHQID